MVLFANIFFVKNIFAHDTHDQGFDHNGMFKIDSFLKKDYFELPELKLDMSAFSSIVDTSENQEVFSQKEEKLKNSHFEVNVSLINETDYFEKDVELEYVYKRGNIFELESKAHYLNSTNSELRNGELSIDLFPDDQWSPFGFTEYTSNEGESYEYDYKRSGGGVAWVPKIFNNSKSFPFKHKFSLAHVYESERGQSPSFRYKLYVDWKEDFSIRATYFLLDYSQSREVIVKYKLSKNLALSYKIYYQEIETEGVTTNYHKNHLRLGWEVKF